MSILTYDDVLEPLDELVSKCQDTVFMGLRLTDQISQFPQITEEERRLLKITPSIKINTLQESKLIFQKWILLNGFNEIYNGLRLALERLLVVKKCEHQIKNNLITKEEIEAELTKASQKDLAKLINKINNLFPDNHLIDQQVIDSYRLARNCLQHRNGILKQKDHCNNKQERKLILFTKQLRLLYLKDNQYVPAVLGEIDLESAEICLGAEDNRIEFSMNDDICFSLKQFIALLQSVTIFIRSDLARKLEINSSNTWTPRNKLSIGIQYKIITLNQDFDPAEPAV